MAIFADVDNVKILFGLIAGVLLFLGAIVINLLLLEISRISAYPFTSMPYHPPGIFSYTIFAPGILMIMLFGWLVIGLIKQEFRN